MDAAGEDPGSSRNVAVEDGQWARRAVSWTTPGVIDLATPDGVTQGDAPACDGSTLARLSFVSLQGDSSGCRIAAWGRANPNAFVFRPA